MNKKLVLSLALGTVGVAALWAGKKDPVVMKVGNTDVTRSEFEYLYHKNAGQQLEPQTIEEYAEMFKVYKQKVADALNEKLDTLPAFVNELKGYLVDLKAPYAQDSVYIKQLMHQIYDRMGTEVQAYHIMVAKPRGTDKPKDVKALADSLHTLLKNGADYGDLAARYSDDRGSAGKGGCMGWIVPLMTPCEFEDAVYATAPGQISEIVETPYGYHIIKGGERRPYRGEVLASHILKLVPQEAPQEQQDAVKAEMDSIYDLAIAPLASFDALASKLSDDKSSARQGGVLPWFGAGRMVPEFDSVAFALNVGDISLPFRTAYGWHIIKKLDKRGLAPYAELEPRLKQAMANRNDQRRFQITRHNADNLRKEYKLKMNDKVVARMYAWVKEHGLNADFNPAFEADANEPFMSFRDKKYTVGDFLEHNTHFRDLGYPSTGVKDLETRIENFQQQELFHYFYGHLSETNAEYRNLENEYRDGMLLFEISNRKVWDKASKDTDGLNAYFAAHCGDYVWNTPRAKGVLVQAQDKEAMARCGELLDSLGADQGVAAIRSELQKRVRVDRILLQEGENPLVDALVFGKDMTANADSKYPEYCIYGLKVLQAPECVDDVKAAVTSDYQDALEREWLRELDNKYPAVIYEKELKKIK